ncbi:MAG: hypothetical protein IJZ62_05910 [Clostridia bacterium]|nr:hypothetical protein [Clostridia bacterium]
MAEKRITKREYFGQLAKVVEKAEITEEVREQLTAFIGREVELLNKKSGTGKETKTQKENKALAEVVVAEIGKVGKPVAIAELIKASEVLAEYTTQKLTPIVKKLAESGRLVVTTEKKRNYYTVA